jgi:hypothetical protein
MCMYGFVCFVFCTFALHLHYLFDSILVLSLLGNSTQRTSQTPNLSPVAQADDAREKEMVSDGIESKPASEPVERVFS